MQDIAIYISKYFEIVIFRQFWRPLAAITQLWAATITRNHLKMAEMDSAKKKKKKEMSYQMCVCSKNHLEATSPI